MKTFAQRLWARVRSRQAAIVVAVAVALSISFAVVVHAADPRLTDADQALQKAKALLQASEIGTTSPQAEKQFQRHVDRAVGLVDRAREEIQAAKDVADAPIPSS